MTTIPRPRVKDLKEGDVIQRTMTMQHPFETRAKKFESEVRNYLNDAGLKERDFRRLTEIFLNNQGVVVNTIEIEVEKPVMVPRKLTTLVEIHLAAAEMFNVPADYIPKKTRKREIVQARQVAMYLSQVFTRHSLKTIGKYYGGRDHTTVIHSCQTVKDLMQTDKWYKSVVDSLIIKLGEK